MNVSLRAREEKKEAEEESRLIFTTDLGTLSLYAMKFRAYDFLAKFNSTDLSERNFVSVSVPLPIRAPKILKVAGIQLKQLKFLRKDNSGPGYNFLYKIDFSKNCISLGR